MPSKELVEKWAIKLALGNNGGEWAKHYTDDQKQLWRDRAREALTDMGKDLAQS
jgi:hypothetical protein